MSEWCIWGFERVVVGRFSKSTFSKAHASPSDPSPEGEGGPALKMNLAFVMTYGLLNNFSAKDAKEPTSSKVHIGVLLADRRQKVFQNSLQLLHLRNPSSSAKSVIQKPIEPIKPDALISHCSSLIIHYSPLTIHFLLLHFLYKQAHRIDGQHHIAQAHDQGRKHGG